MRHSIINRPINGHTILNKTHNWHGQRPATEDAAKQAIIEACFRCIDRQGYTRTTMADIARETGISRTTLYRRYKNIYDIIYDALNREAHDFAARAAEHCSQFGNAEEMMVEAIIFTVQQLPATHYIQHMFGSSLDQVFNQDLFNAEIFQEGLDKAIRPILDNDPQLQEHPLDVAEMMIRFTVSLLQYPGKYGNSEPAMREFLTHSIVPIFFNA